VSVSRSRDLHDTVAHHLSAIAIRARAALATATQSQATVDALRDMESEASLALADMRRMTRVLRTNRRAEWAPTAGITHLERLRRSTGDGPGVEVRVSGVTNPLADGDSSSRRANDAFPTPHGDDPGSPPPECRPHRRLHAGRALVSRPCYARRMGEVASRELRNETRKVLDRVAAGEDVTITVDGRPVARIVPLEQRPRWLRRDLLFERLGGAQADAALARELDDLTPETTDELDGP
jgi:prevent-host-death family protein